MYYNIRELSRAWVPAPGYTWVPGYTWMHLGVPGYMSTYLTHPGLDQHITRPIRKSDMF